MRRLDFLRAGGAALTGALLGDVSGLRSATAQTIKARLPNSEVFDQTGRSLKFYDDLIRDRAVLLNFFYTGCGDTCPLVSQNLREVQDILGDRMGRDIFIVSVSLQPELETPSILHDYAKLWDARPGWSFVTGPPDRIEQLRRTAGFADSEPDFAGQRDSHTGMVRYGNDRLDRWGCAPGLGRPVWIAKAVTMLADMG